MNSDDPNSLANLAKSVAAGTVTASHLLEETLTNARQQQHLNAFISLASETNEPTVDVERRDERLLGIPIAVKDNLDVAGLPCTAECLRDISTYLNRHRAPITAWEIVEQIAGTFEHGLLEQELGNEAVPHETYRLILAAGRPAVAAAYHRCFDHDRLDALVLPTTPIPARSIGLEDSVALNGQPVATLPTYMRNVDPTEAPRVL